MFTPELAVRSSGEEPAERELCGTQRRLGRGGRIGVCGTYGGYLEAE